MWEKFFSVRSWRIAISGTQRQAQTKQVRENLDESDMKAPRGWL